MAALTIFALLAALSAAVCGEDCIWNKDEDYPLKPPIIFDDSFKMILPVLEGKDRIVRVPQASELTLACPGNKLKDYANDTVQAVCSGGQILTIEGKETRLKDISCKKKVKESIKRNVGHCGPDGKGIIEVIGFEVTGLQRFYDLITICYDSNEETNLYSRHVIHGQNIAAKDVDPKRPPFKSSKGFFNISMSTTYSKKSQLKLMKEVLGDDKLANTMIDSHKQFYFAKGHMAPDADFVTEYEQDATYYYINAVPQWQAFNNGNWKQLEFATRDLAVHRGTELTIYSGSWGNLKLDDINGNPVGIYLGHVYNKEVIPAPALNWKVIYEKESKSAIAVIGINNPHVTSAPKPVCNDICSRLSWIDFDVNDLGHGFTYCCSVDDLRKAIPFVPDLGHVQLLSSFNSTGNPCGK